MKIKNTLLWSSVKRMFVLLPALACFAFTAQAQFTTVVGSNVNTAGNSAIPSDAPGNTGGCTVGVQTTIGTRFNLTNPTVGTLGTTTRIQTVTLNLTHTFNADLDIFLIAPNGGVLELSTDNGGGGDNINVTFVDDRPALNYPNITTAGATTIAGFFNPEGSLVAPACGTAPTGTVTTLAGFTGAANGLYQLVIYDDAGGDIGALISWSITFAPLPLGAFTIGGAADGGVIAPLNIGLCPGATTTPITIPVVAPVVAGTTLTLQVGTGTPVVVTPGSIFNLPLTSVPGTVILTYNLGPNLATVTQTVNLTTNDAIAPVVTCPAATTVTLAGGQCSSTLTLPAATVTDNCPAVLGATIVFQGFGTQPAGWTTSSSRAGAIPPFLFDFAALTTSIGFAPPATFVGPFALINDDGRGTLSTYNPAVETITSAVYNIAAYQNTVLSFNWFNEVFIGSGILNAQVSGNGGATWTTITGFPVTTQTSGTTTYAIPAALRTSQFQFRFSYDDEGAWAWGAGIDNFRITGDLPSGGPITSSFRLGNLATNPLVAGGANATGAFPIGTTTIVFSATDASGNVGTCSTTVTVLPFANPATALSCNDLIYFSVDANCTGTITADQVLSGTNYRCFSNYIVELDKIAPFGNGPWVPAVVGAVDVNKTYYVRVTDPVTGNRCWGNVTIQDKLPPVLICNPLTLPCNFPDPLLLPTSSSTFALSVAASTNEPLPQTLNDNSEVVIDVPVNAGAGTINDVDVLVNLSGSVFFNNIQIDVVSPSGTVVTLMDQVGGCSPAPIFARFDDEGDAALTCVSLTTGLHHNIPFNFGLLSSFDGQLATGIWHVRFRDIDGFGDVSTINAAQIFVSTNSAFVNIGLTNGITLPNPNVQVINANTFVVGGGLLDPCSSVTLTYVDVSNDQTCASGLTRIVTRKYTATDFSGNSSTCIQTISLVRPTLDDVVCPPNYDNITAPAFDCGTLAGYPTPEAIQALGLQGFPYVLGVPAGCNINYDYTDLRIAVCDGTYKIARTWTIIDWCTGNHEECFQIIKVLDSTGPTFTCPADLTVSVNSQNCCALVNLPDVIITDNCSRIAGISGMIVETSIEAPFDTLAMVPIGGTLTTYPGNNVWLPDTLGAFGITPCLPLGTHTVTYVVTDNCGNTSSCTFHLTVLDLEPPVASCQTTTTVALGPDDPYDCYGPAGPNGVPAAFGACEFGGVTRIPASDFNTNSYDNCHPVLFTVRRMFPYSACIEGLNHVNTHPDCSIGNQPGSEYETAILENDTIKFYCCEVGTTQTVILRVYQLEADGVTLSRDLDGNAIYNECMVQVEVQDKIRPTCIAPPTAIVSCTNFDPTLWAYGIPTFYDNCCLLSAPNNYVYLGQAQCGLTVANNYSNFDTVCNRGTIRRTFTVSDCHNQSTTCTQLVVVNYNQDYYVRFPNDMIVTVCDGTPNFGQPVFFGKDCELLATSYVDQIYTVVPDACYKIERTWTIINWCTYNPNLPCIDVPNPNPTIVNSQANLQGPTVSACGNSIPGWAPTVVRINPTDPATTNYCTFYNANANCYRYKQIIKIIDGVAPVIQCPQPSPDFCAVLPANTIGFGDYTLNDPLLYNASYYFDQVSQSHDLCEGPTDLHITASDACSLDNIDIRYLLFLDLDGDGIMETVINSNTFNLPIAQQPAPGTLQFGNANNPNFAGGTNYTFDFRPVNSNQKYRFALQTTVSGVNKTGFVRWNTLASPTNYVIPEIPYGTHKIKWFVADGCGNESVCEYQFIVRDCKPPTVTCLNGLSINNMPNGMIQLWATDFFPPTSLPYDNCTPTNLLKYGIRRSGTGTGFPVNSPGVTFTCADVGTQPVEIWAIDLAGNASFCETYVIIQDNGGNCTPGTSASVAGVLKTETSVGLEEGNVEVSGSNPATPPFSMFDLSNAAGEYAFSNAIPMASNLTITPTQDNNPLNGVTTYDLVLISKHILGIEPLNSPYKMIAADANKSGSITAFDIVELRKLILGIYQELPNNNSWRFVEKSFNFPVPSNPFSTVFPENTTVGNIQASQMNDDFMAMKVGDVNQSAIASSLQSSDDRSAGTLLLDVNDRSVKAGETFDVTFKTAEAAQGFQFTLKLDGLTVTEIAAGDKVSADNFGVFQDALTASIDGAQEFTVSFRAAKAGKISELLSVSSRITKAEGYNSKGEREEVALRFNENGSSIITGVGFELYQNQPNPFVGHTSIGFNLPAAATATLTVYDESGRTIFTQKGDFAKGYNAIPVERSVLNTSGLLYYKLETATDMATKKMIQSK